MSNKNFRLIKPQFNGDKDKFVIYKKNLKLDIYRSLK